jgi:hypothetical protein
MTQTATAVVRGQIIIEAPIERAFTVFTERFGDFKPPEHHLLGAAIAETVFEPRVGGHIYDRGVDGTSVAGPAFWPTSHRNVLCSAGISGRSGKSRPSRTTPARSRSGGSLRPRSAPEWSWSTETSTGTAPAGRPSARVSRTTPAGRCT